jgi:hypothetical protein
MKTHFAVSGTASGALLWSGGPSSEIGHNARFSSASHSLMPIGMKLSQIKKRPNRCQEWEASKNVASCNISDAAPVTFRRASSL